ncbi:hypothetical protein FHX42_003714 [Saccharopolyspora lacisalsi]|uniref:Uncharacterized protein n=1 Tax=Halosaccharopolyspora lacisalsi TaxID=1000566 RepID=A0A839E622_9PSEU|nr:hypothetical protein [Halosaccharopolyspora lacisalsi]MBA8826338.1 hypothetical protein [Halosaccharopolyspora lacisalsi]
MPVSASTRERSRVFLDEDGEIRYLFPAEVWPSAKPSVLVVVSREAITVLSTGLWSRRKPKSVLARLPRETVLGPVDTHLTPSFTVEGIDYELDEEYVAVVHAADAEITRSGGIPPDPFPDV